MQTCEHRLTNPIAHLVVDNPLAESTSCSVGSKTYCGLSVRTQDDENTATTRTTGASPKCVPMRVRVSSPKPQEPIAGTPFASTIPVTSVVVMGTQLGSPVTLMYLHHNNTRHRPITNKSRKEHCNENSNLKPWYVNEGCNAMFAVVLGNSTHQNHNKRNI